MGYLANSCQDLRSYSLCGFSETVQPYMQYKHGCTTIIGYRTTVSMAGNHLVLLTHVSSGPREIYIVANTGYNTIVSCITLHG